MLSFWCEVFSSGDVEETLLTAVKSARRYYGATFRHCRFADPVDSLAESLQRFIMSDRA